MPIELTFDLLPVVATILTILAYIVPGFNTWFDQLASDIKQMLMMGIIAVTGIGVALLSYFGFLDIYAMCVSWTCWVWKPLVDIGFAVVTMSGTYVATKHIGSKYVAKRIAAKHKK